jgi:hypothetical protein
MLFASFDSYMSMIMLDFVIEIKIEAKRSENPKRFIFSSPKNLFEEN